MKTYNQPKTTVLEVQLTHQICGKSDDPGGGGTAPQRLDKYYFHK